MLRKVLEQFPEVSSFLDWPKKRWRLEKLKVVSKFCWRTSERDNQPKPTKTLISTFYFIRKTTLKFTFRYQAGEWVSQRQSLSWHFLTFVSREIIEFYCIKKVIYISRAFNHNANIWFFHMKHRKRASFVGMWRVIKADIRFYTVDVPRKRALISPFFLFYRRVLFMNAGNSTVALCVISKLTELLSFEGDTQNY